MSGLIGGGTKPTNTESGKLDSLVLGTSSYGQDILQVFGCYRVNANVIWSEPVAEVKHTTSQSTGGKGGGGGGGTTTTYTYYATFAAMFCAGQIYGMIALWFDQNRVYYMNSDAVPDAVKASNAIAAQFDLHHGSFSQAQDVTIVASEGSNAPAYRGRAYLKISQLEITTNYGNRFPTISAEISTNGNLYGGNQITRVLVSVASILTAICGLAGIPSGNVDASLVTSELWGFAVKSGSYSQTIQNLLDTFQIGVRESGSKVVFYPLASASVLTIDIGELGADTSARSSAGSTQDLLMRADADDRDLPKLVSISYYDVNNSHQQSIQQVVRTFPGLATDIVSQQYDVVLDSGIASMLCRQKLWRAWAERTTYGPFKLQSTYLALEPGDTITINDPVSSINYVMRLTKVTIGADFTVECEAKSQDVGVFTQNSNAGADPNPPAITTNIPGTPDLVAMNLPALVDSQGVQGQAGFYAACTATGTRFGGTLYWSLDGGSTYGAVPTGSDMPSYATMGTIATAVASHDYTFWDTDTTIDVVIERGQLQSVTDDQVLAGSNACWIGNGATGVNGEIIQFANATLLSGSTYRLSRLLRGRRGTEYAIGVHGASERFVLLDASVTFVTFNLATVGQPIHLKFVPYYADISSISPQAFTPNGENLMPFNPVDPIASRNGGGDFTLSWTRRGRLGSELPYGGGDIPVSENVENYVIYIMDSTYTTIKRKLSSGTPTITYLGTDQITDFGSHQSTIYTAVIETSASVGSRHAIYNGL